jgi:tRNA(Ile)-lysidine synthase
MDDQAETVLLNLMRGTGIDGLRAMELGPRHPILDLRREETLAICAELQLAVALDPSNASPEFSRNRVRLEVLPMLADIASRDVVPLLARLAAVSAEEVDFLEAEALAQIPEVTDVSSLREAPAVLARRRLRGWLRRLDGDGEHPPSLAELERVLASAK